MSSVRLLREQLRVSHGWLEGTMADVTQEQADRLPPGKAHPIGERYAHVIQSEDVLGNAVRKGGPPLMATSWAGRRARQRITWRPSYDKARTAKVDQASLRRYAQAVFAASDDYLASLGEADLAGTRDLSSAGMGTPTVDWILGSVIVGHVHDVMGEISAVKGRAGRSGVPLLDARRDPSAQAAASVADDGMRHS